MAARHIAGGQYFAPAAERADDKMDLKLFDSEDPNVTATLRKILQMNAETIEEKFKILDARDKLYKIMRDKDPSLKRGALIATCPDMCPEKERLLREYQSRGSIFELTNFSKYSNFNHSLAVKEYARSSADQEEPLPHDLRPISVLSMTMSHLLHNVVDFCELSDDNLEEWYMFVWDRTRALRKELTQQGVCSLESVTLVEQCARFHIHCAERLVDQDRSIYDDKINTENLTKCLQTLKYMYKDLAKEDLKCPNQPEFICYNLLLNLNNSSVFTELSDMSDSLMTSEPVKFALDVMTSWETRNYIRFFNLVKKGTYLNCCLLRRYFGEMRLYAIKTMIRSYCTKTYSPQIVLSRFEENLNFEGEEECVNFLSQCNFNFHKIKGRAVVNFDRVLFQNPKSTLPTGRAYIFIEEKKQRPLSVIMAGGTLPPKLYENYVPQNSFTEDGELKRDLLPKTDLFDFSVAPPPTIKFGNFDSEKSTDPSLDAFQKEENESFQDPKSEKKTDPPAFSQSSIFSVKQTNPSSTNIFTSPQTFTFGSKIPETTNIFGRNFQSTGSSTTDNIFNTSGNNRLTTNIFGNQSSNTLFSNNKTNIFGSESTSFPNFKFNSPAGEESEKEPQTIFPTANLNKNISNTFGTTFQFKSCDEDAKLKEEQEKKERMEKERLERERIEKEKEEEEKRRKEEEQRAKMLLEKKRLEEENRKREIERREREKREEEERLRKEELDRKEREEKRRRDEKARQERLKEENAKHLAEMKRQEENKRKIELEHKRKVDNKMLDLKKKLQKWKTKIIFEKWRMKTWSSVEERKMKEYFKEVKLKYPPVCTEEILEGNPYGLLIPSILTFEKFQNWRKDLIRVPSKKLLIVSDDLPLLKVDNILGKGLEDRARSLGCKLDPYPWKLVISVPDELESPEYWKNIETFVEMHFIDNFNWQFGIQEGPLYCRSGSRGTFRFNISIRRLRGCKLYEGSEPNSLATTGSNALIFFLTGSANKVTCERLKSILKSRASLPKIPLVIVALNNQPDQSENLKKFLEIKVLQDSYLSDCHIISVIEKKHELVAQLIKSLNIAVAHSSAPSSRRISHLSTFFTGNWLSSLWRRIEISLSNFKITLQEPKVLIEFYNSCIEEFGNIFFDKSYNQYTTLALEFSEVGIIPPEKTTAYREKVNSLLNRLKLPHWPSETPKSSHQLNYRIHQYCKKVAGSDKVKMKSLKWILYRIIRRSLLWKGLDIYCDEDIGQILLNFPWIEVFQEISRVITRQLNEEVSSGKKVTVVYDIEKIEKFSFESSFISNFLKKSKRQSPKKFVHSFGEEELEDLNPCLEKDSIVYAYSAAIERETNKRKREECIEESLDNLFSSPDVKRFVLDEEEKGEEEEESKKYDLTQIESNFQNLNDRLDGIKKRMLENSKILMDIQEKMN